MFYGASGTRRLAEKAPGGRVGVKLFPGSRLGAIPLIDGIRLAEVRGVGRLLCRCGSRRSCPRAVRRNGIRKACSTIGRAVWAVRQIGVNRCSNASRRTTEARGRLSGGVYAPPSARLGRQPLVSVASLLMSLRCTFRGIGEGSGCLRKRRKGRTFRFAVFSVRRGKTSLVREQEHRRTAQRCLFGPGAPGSAVSRTAFRTPMIPRTASRDRPVLPANVPFPARIPIASSESVRGRRVVSE